MQIVRQSWHFNAYKWSYTRKRDWCGRRREVPEMISFCAYWRRIFLIFPLQSALRAVGYPLMFLVLMAGFSVSFILYLVIFSWNFIFGKKPERGFWKEFMQDGSVAPNDWYFVPYKKFSFGWVRFYPWHVIMLASLASLSYFMVSIQADRAVVILELFFLKNLLLIAFATTAMVFIWKGLRSLLRSKPVKEGIDLTIQYFKAKKQKACPIITFVDDPERLQLQDS